jgi:tyrosyl-tRNA synthetase
MEEVRQVRTLSDARLNMAKAVLAFEATKITHGEEAAVAAWKAATAAFHTKPVEASLFPSSTIPRAGDVIDVSAIPAIEKSMATLQAGIPAFELFLDAGLCSSKGEARRLLSQGGGYVNDGQVASFDERIGTGHIRPQGDILLRKGKKTYALVHVR